MRCTDCTALRHLGGGDGSERERVEDRQRALRWHQAKEPALACWLAGLAACERDHASAHQFMHEAFGKARLYSAGCKPI